MRIVIDLAPGTRYDPKAGKLYHDPDQVAHDLDIAADVRTMRVLVDIANSLDEDIQFTFDTPSMNANGKLPCLDLQLWLNPQSQIYFEFYA